MPTLIVRPPWAAQPVWTGAWVVAEGSAQASSGLMSWEHLDELPTCDELVLAVPAALLSWHVVTLPKLPSSRWRTALESLLEERLLVDAQQVHLALAPAARGGQEVLVAACDKLWLSRTLELLEQAGRSAARLVPEFEPDGSGIHLLGHPERGWLVDCSSREVQCLPLSHPVQDALRAWQGLRQIDQVHAEPGLATAAEQAWGAPPQLHPASQHFQQAASSSWNLAQFDLASRSALHKRLARQWRLWWTEPAWRAVRWGLLGLAALQVIGLQAWAWKERSAQQAMQTEIKAVLTRSFPQVQLVIDPVLQMEREVQALAQASGQASGGDLTRMLATLSGLASSPPEALHYKAGELTLVNWKPDVSQRAALEAELERKGYQLESSDKGWTLRSSTAGGKP